MTYEQREVMVVGGGPAGAVTALLLARAGHDVLLLERRALPRPKPCGDCLSAGSTRVLDRLGLLPAIDELGPAHLRGWRIIAPDGSSFVTHFDEIEAGGDAAALAVSREQLDMVLLDAAIAAGVEVRCGARVTEVACDAQGCMLRLHDTEGAIRARLLIGADGLRSIVARAVDAVRRPPRLRKLSLSTHTAPVRTAAAGDMLGEMHLTDGACMGIAPVNAAGNACNVTLVVSSHAARGAFEKGPRGVRLNAFVDHWQQRFPLLAGGEPTRPLPGEEWMASGPFDVPVCDVAFDGVALVGDAAGYFDPFTGQGIHQALAGAEQLAGVAARALRQPGPVRRERLAAWAEAHAALTLGARRVQRLIELVLVRPRLANAAIRALARSGPARNALLGVTSDLRAPASLLDPRLATSTLHSLARAS